MVMREQDVKKREMLARYLGCLIGGGVGDALGYAVEFYDADRIFAKFGKTGITEYQTVNGVARISDDTQMTLFTANGLLVADTINKLIGENGQYRDLIAACYIDWFKTQESYGENGEFSWLNNVDDLNHPRAPGGTCMSALGSRRLGWVSDPVNNSKGCGGVMRVAPIGLYFDGVNMGIDGVAMLAAESAAITHGHPLGYISAAMLAYIICSVVHKGLSLMDAVEESMVAMARIFDENRSVKQMNELVKRAIELSERNDITDLQAISALGEGWVGEEALAIAVYCSLKYQNDFEKAIIAAVNHRGDSDSTGAITGNILGAYLGIDAIPEKYKDCLECRDVITEIAEDLFYGVPDLADERLGAWVEKYVHHTYCPDVNKTGE